MLHEYIHALLAAASAKCDLLEVYDGEENIKCTNIDAVAQAVEIIESVEEATVSMLKVDPVGRARVHLGSFDIIPGNDAYEQLSDYSSDSELCHEVVTWANGRLNLL